MLRYNNQSAMSKPVDYYRPLTVDVSVEYELPKEVSPPPGSAPLLIIHPSAYFRSKVNQPLASSSALLHSKSLSSKSSTSSSRHHHQQSHDLNPSSSSSSLFYSKSSVGGSNNGTSYSHGGNPINSSNNSSSSNHIKNRSSCSSTAGPSITRSRSVIMNGSDVPFRSSAAVAAAAANLANLAKYEDEFFNASSSSSYSKVSSTKKLPTAAQQNTERLSSYSNYGSSSNFIVPMEPATGDLEKMSTSTFGVGSTAGHTAASNKRLRMMSQQQQQHHHPLYNPAGQQGPIEPLNLAITPSNPLLHAPQSASYSNFSTFIGNSYKAVQQQQQQHQQANNNKANNNYSSMITGLGLNYASTFPSNHRNSGSTAVASQSNTYAASQQSGRFLKECPIPVDKGSGSDSGVCSENDSDVSPPMAPFSSSSSHHPRRSTILSQDLPTSGCYCCCCPSSSSSRKNSSSSQSKGSSKSSFSSSSSSSSLNNNLNNQHYQQHPLGAHNSNKQQLMSSHQGGGGLGSNNNSSSASSSSLFNYGLGSLNSTISMSMMTMPGPAEGHLTAHHNNLSAMDASVALGATPLDLDSTYRKWLGGSSVGPGLVIDGNSSSLGRWFQV